MKERPILFSTDLVPAIPDGRKTMTRRIVKQQDRFKLNTELQWEIKPHKDSPEIFSFWHGTKYTLPAFRCPYGQPGDILWVREAYCKDYFEFGGGGHAYKADWSEIGAEYVPQPKWKPGIHMPKSACRIWLQVEAVNVERLQDISEEDAIAEGITAYFDKMVSGTRFTYQPGLLSNSYTAKEEFEKLWRAINGPESWEQNPWVWVISFKVLSTTGKPEFINP